MGEKWVRVKHLWWFVWVVNYMNRKGTKLLVGEPLIYLSRKSAIQHAHELAERCGADVNVEIVGEADG